MSCLTPLLLTTPRGHERHLPDADTEARGDRPCRPEGGSASPGPHHHGGANTARLPALGGLSTSVSHLLLEEMTLTPHVQPRRQDQQFPCRHSLSLMQSHMLCLVPLDRQRQSRMCRSAHEQTAPHDWEPTADGCVKSPQVSTPPTLIVCTFTSWFFFKWWLLCVIQCVVVLYLELSP